eukprot:TRINITY_DN4643_c0_g2_i1.p1 TRINITY_DN4643_c0_g2~~TRINITY_DN4643_c0_g2_i1.p1  ORF type:complete len:332 (+),score=64.46 TRINITY_DN4643_c0_g2_i1:32-1027(+)
MGRQKKKKMHDRKREEQSETEKRNTAAKIAAYKKLCELCIGMRKQNLHTLEAYKTVEKILLINPEFYTMWNYKKEILNALMKGDRKRVIYGSGDVIEGVAETAEQINARWFTCELAFNQKIIKDRDHKSYCTWHHRRYLVKNILCADFYKDTLRTEKALCEKLLLVDDRNFHCWGYRAWITERLQTLGEFSEQTELDHAKVRLSSNFSNYSAWHARGKIVQASPAQTTKDSLVSEDIALAENAFYTEPSDQSAWIYGYWALTLSQASPPDTPLEAFKAYATELHEDDESCKWPALTLLRYETDPTKRVELIEGLIETDPMRAGYYRDLLQG